MADTKEAAIKSAMNGHKFFDAGCSLSTDIHHCRNLQMDGTPCHVGLYGGDTVKAKCVTAAELAVVAEACRALPHSSTPHTVTASAQGPCSPTDFCY